MSETNTSPRTVRVFQSFADAQEAEREDFLSMSPEERLDVVEDCVRDYLALRNEPESRLQRVFRVLDR
jgi:hypothetical protein